MWVAWRTAVRNRSGDAGQADFANAARAKLIDFLIGEVQELNLSYCFASCIKMLKH